MTGNEAPRDAAPSSEDGDAAGQADLAAQFSDLARALQQQDDPRSTLVEITRAAVALIPGVEEASISRVVRRREVSSGAPTGELARTVDEMQDRLGEGPCLDAVYDELTVRVPDMRTETRWPRFSREAAAAGVASMLSFQLYVEGDNLGALNLYARAPGSFDAESEHVGVLFASHAAIAYDAANTESGLGRAVETRQVIGQAQGILMERHKISADDAFALLVRASQRSNTKLRELAERLVHSGALA